MYHQRVDYGKKEYEKEVSPEHPRVSVVLPTYDRAGILADSIRSVLDQTYTDFELIIVDDGSQDRTEAVVTEVGDSRVRYVTHETNRGAPAARNTGIDVARGDIVAFQDSDDEWLPEKLRKQVNVFEDASRDVGVVYTGMNRQVGDETRYLPYRGVEQKSGDIKSSIIRHNFISTQMAAVRRECFDVVGDFDENMEPLEDWELWIRLSQRYQFEFVDEPLVRGAVQPDSISKNLAAIVDSRERIVEKHYEQFDTASLANHLFFIGHGAMKLGQTQKGKRYLRKAVRTKPRLRYAVATVVSNFGEKPYNTTYRAYKFFRGA